MCARMRKVRLLVLLGALLLKVSLSLGGIRGAHVWTKKKILINSKKRSQNTHNKRVGLYIPRDIFFEYPHTRGGGGGGGAQVFFFGGAFFMSFWFGRDTRVLLVCLLLRKKGRFRYRSWIRSNNNISKLFLRFFVSLFPPPLFFFKNYIPKHPSLVSRRLVFFVGSPLTRNVNERH